VNKDEEKVLRGSESFVPSATVEDLDNLGYGQADGVSKQLSRMKDNDKAMRKREGKHDIANTGGQVANGVMDGLASGDVVSMCKHFMQAAFQAAIRSISAIGMRNNARKELGIEAGENIANIFRVTSEKPEQAGPGIAPSMTRRGPGM